jgi:uncharacterized DUF497 family protein
VFKVGSRTPFNHLVKDREPNVIAQSMQVHSPALRREEESVALPISARDMTRSERRRYEKR